LGRGVAFATPFSFLFIFAKTNTFPNRMKTPKLIISLTNIDPSASPRSSCPSSYDFVDDKKNLKKRCLLDNLTIVEIPRTESAETLNIELDSNNRWEYHIDMSHPAIKKEKMIQFWKDHPISKNLVDDETEIFLDNTFTYEFTDVTLENDKRVDDEIIKCYTTFQSLTEDQREKVAIYFGVATRDLDASQLEREMVSLENGVLIIYPENRKDFLEDINKMFDHVTLNLQLAETYGVLKTDGESRLIAGSPIGNTFSECLVSLRNRPEFYNQLKRDLIAASLIPFSSDEVSPKMSSENNSTAKKAVPAGKVNVGA